jgi:hypothetical protein
MTNREEEIRRLRRQLQILQGKQFVKEQARGLRAREKNELRALKRATGQYTKKGRFSSFVKREFNKGAKTLAVAAKRAAKEYKKAHNK